MGSVEQEEALRSGRIEIDFTRPLDYSSLLRGMTIDRHAMILAAPQDHSVAMRRRPMLNHR
jgi:hypothetical protein